MNSNHKFGIIGKLFRFHSMHGINLSNMVSLWTQHLKLLLDSPVTDSCGWINLGQLTFHSILALRSSFYYAVLLLFSISILQRLDEALESGIPGQLDQAFNEIWARHVPAVYRISDLATQKQYVNPCYQWTKSRPRQYATPGTFFRYEFLLHWSMTPLPKHRTCETASLPLLVGHWFTDL